MKSLPGHTEGGQSRSSGGIAAKQRSYARLIEKFVLEMLYVVIPYKRLLFPFDNESGDGSRVSARNLCVSATSSAQSGQSWTWVSMVVCSSWDKRPAQ